MKMEYDGFELIDLLKCVILKENHAGNNINDVIITIQMLG